MPKVKDPKRRSNCPLACTLELFGDKWILLIVRDLIYHDTRTFKELEQSWEHIPVSTLADRLKKLESMDLINKKPYQNRPIRYQYQLTDKGLTLIPILKAMTTWGQEHIESTITVLKIENGKEVFVPPETV
ncbi:hypothetical protein Misp06_02893 [Microbulbifer sp. NBRC 101763]|uniref:winged helix-turn-helix transcriptional regulator n=1 Tax=Microbulbifer sp. NBRC 101763 TaxID=1113820 RepID=UPI0030949068